MSRKKRAIRYLLPVARVRAAFLAAAERSAVLRLLAADSACSDGARLDTAARRALDKPMRSRLPPRTSGAHPGKLQCAQAASGHTA